MAGSFNRCIFVGNLVRDPEIRYVGSGAAVTKFTLAVNRRSKQQEETDFIDMVAWDKLAETCNTYLKKGMSVLVEGRLSIRSYETKEGEKRKATEVVINVMQMLDRTIALYAQWKVDLAIVEDTASGSGLLQLLKCPARLE